MNDKQVRLDMKVDDLIEDERVNQLCIQIRDNMNDEYLLELIERVVQVSNSHIWGLMISLVQEKENNE